MSFKNKIVLVTGSGAGIGEATAISFAKEGADVVIVDINETALNKTAEKCKEFGNQVLNIKTNVAKSEDVKHAIDTTLNMFGKLDIVINNAGVIRRETLISGNILMTYDEMMDTNLRSVIAMTNFATPYLMKTKGCIVNTSSIVTSAMSMAIQAPLYSVSKAGVDIFTRLAALELAPSGVRVNAVSPGPVNTNIVKDLPMDIRDVGAGTALKKISEPQEVADLIMFLASDKAKSITGSIFPIDNGSSLL